MADTGINWDLILSDESIKEAFKKVEAQAAKSGQKIDESLSNGKKGGFLSGLTDSFSEAALVVTGLNQGLELTKKGINKVTESIQEMVNAIKEADRIKLVNTQFDVLTSRAGIAGDTLRDAFKKAASGTVEMTEVTAAANRALLDLGDNAAKLPTLFELARKAGKLSGQDTLSAFEAINFAIQSGNTRSLRQIGLFIDSEKALNAFAKTMNITADKLSLAGRQQAILNEVLLKGQSAFDGLGAGSETATKKLTVLDTSIKEFSEAVSLRLGKIFGPVVAAAAEIAAHAIEALAKSITTDSGTIQSQIDETTKSIEEMKLEMQSLKDQQKRNPLAIDLIAEQVQLEQKLKESVKQLGNLRIAFDDAQKAAGRGAQKGPSLITLPTPQEVESANIAYQSALQAAFSQNIQLRQQQAQLIQDENARELELRVLDQAKLKELQGEHEIKIEQIRKQFQDRRLFSEQQVNDLVQSETDRFHSAQEVVNDQAAARQLAKSRALAEQLKAITVSGLSTTFQEVGRRLQAGQALFEDFGKGIVGIVGDLAIKLGEGLVAQGLAIEIFSRAINTLLPGSGLAAAAAGLGLIIFGSALKASVGLGGGGSTSGGGGGATGAPGEGQTGVTQPEDFAPKGPTAQVVFNVNGNIIPRDRAFAQEIADTLTEVGFAQGVQIIGA